MTKFKIGDKVRNVIPFQSKSLFRSIGTVVEDPKDGRSYKYYVQWGDEGSPVYTNQTWGFSDNQDYCELVDDLPDDGRKDKWV